MTLAIRLFQCVFLCIMATYCLLAYLPFTYQQIIQGNLLPWLGVFGRFQPILWWILTVVGRTPRSAADAPVGLVRSLAGSGSIWLSAHVLAGVWLIAQPLTDQLHSPAAALGWSLAAFASLAWTGWLDWRAVRGEMNWPQLSTSGDRLFLTSLGSAVLLTAAYAVAAAWRMPGAHALLAIFSLDAHLFIFMGMFAVLALGRTISEVTRRPARTEFWFVAAVAGFGVEFMLAHTIFPVVSFDGAKAEAVAVWAAASIVLFWSGVCARLRVAGGSAEDGLDLFLLPLTFWAKGSSRVSTSVVLVLAIAAGCSLSVAAAAMDWNYLMQKVSATMVWLIAFALLYAIAARVPRTRMAAFMLTAIAILGVHRVLMAREPEVDSALRQYASYNASYKVVYDWMAPTEASGDYYRFLAANTNLSRERALAPVEVLLRDQLEPGAGPRPNIFIFVLDSLRRDYLSPYNPAVTFTPAIESFGKESLVFDRAFARYAGTGLSEPSIWSGAMLPHKQYVLPFHPMNSLEKLLDAGGYRRFISMDTILAALLTHDARTTELDEGRMTMDFDLAHTVQELTAKLSNSPAEPVFSYTQPQNLHISVINRAARSVPAGESYPGFDAPYASRLRRNDAAFGQFIAFLKERGLYENSIVILTADHGDSLGEGGRWGHAYTLVPEVLRIPLIVHVPEKLRSAYVSDVKDVAFLTDIAPSLYQLLGQGPTNKSELFGKPLFAPDAAALASYRRDSWLVAASYAPVYGILKNGRELYVSDAVQYRESLYDIAGASAVELTVGPTAKRAYQDSIRRHVRAIGNFYRIETTEGRPQ